MKYLIAILLLVSAPAPAPAMLRIDQTEQPIETVRRIKQKLHRENRTWFSFAGWSLWAAALVWFTSVLGLQFLLVFGSGCLGLFGVVIGWDWLRYALRGSKKRTLPYATE